MQIILNCNLCQEKKEGWKELNLASDFYPFPSSLRFGLLRHPSKAGVNTAGYAPTRRRDKSTGQAEKHRSTLEIKILRIRINHWKLRKKFTSSCHLFLLYTTHNDNNLRLLLSINRSNNLS